MGSDGMESQVASSPSPAGTRTGWPRSLIDGQVRRSSASVRPVITKPTATMQITQTMTASPQRLDAKKVFVNVAVLWLIHNDR
jgi:hypothetical protein